MTKSIYEQTGWKRSHPNMLLMHDSDLLEKITEYNYDMSNAPFVEYASLRGCMSWAFKAGSSLRKYIAKHCLSRSEFLSDTLYLENGEKMSQVDKENLWKCIHLSRAHFQDCWEVYSGTGSIKKSEEPKQAVLF